GAGGGAHVAPPEGFIAGVERRRAERAGAAGPVASRVGSAGGTSDGVAGRRRRAELPDRGAPGRTPRWRYGGGLGRPFQPRGARGGTAGPWRWAANPLRRR